MTQHEILKKHTEKYRTLRVINQSVIEQIEKSVGEAAEEYAKQEAIQFHAWFVLCRRENKVLQSVDSIWNEYQKSKTK